MNARYQPGGDIYTTVSNEFGGLWAARVAFADQQNDGGVALRNTLNDMRQTAKGRELSRPGSSSTAGNLFDQLTTDPLGAPLDSANSALSTLFGNTALAFLRNPAVLLVLVVIGFAVWVYAFGIPRWIKGQ